MSTERPGSEVNGHIEYADHKKRRNIHFSQSGDTFLLYTVTLDKNDVVLAAKAVRWCFTQLVTYDPTRVNTCKHIFNAYRGGNLMLLLPLPFEVDPALVQALKNCSALPVHVFRWSGRVDNFASSAIWRRIECLEKHTPSKATVEEFHNLNRPPPDKRVRVSCEVFELMEEDFMRCPADMRSTWRCTIPCPWLGLENGSITVVFDDFEFVELITCIPIISDASLDRMEYVVSDVKSKTTRKLKPSELKRRQRLNR